MPDDLSTPEAYRTPVQIARQLGLHPDTVRGWIRDGKLPATRVGGRLRVRASDLARVVEELNPDDQEDQRALVGVA